MGKEAGRPRKREQAAKQRTFWITDEAIASLDQLAALLEISRSELVERFVRLPQDEALEVLHKNSRHQDTDSGATNKA